MEQQGKPPKAIRTFQQKWRLISLPNKLMVVATIVIAAASFVNLLVAMAMWNEMHITGADTHKSADAAKDSADLARKNAHLDQRAWLTVSFGTYKYVVNQPLGTTYEVTDTGKTPARNVNGKAVTRFMSAKTIPSFTYEHGTTADLGTMLPGIHQGAVSWLIPSNVPENVRIEPLRVSEQMFRDLHNGTGYIMVYGSISYDSVFGAHHWIKFCQTSGPTAYTQPKECIDYNDVDNNEEP
jgi:hypothetical protein